MNCPINEQTADGLDIHHGIPAKLKLDEKPDLGNVRIVALCREDTTPPGAWMVLGWGLVNCRECLRRASQEGGTAAPPRGSS